MGPVRASHRKGDPERAGMGLALAFVGVVFLFCGEKGDGCRMGRETPRSRLYKDNKRFRDGYIAAGFCKTAPAHGLATRGQLCDACATALKRIRASYVAAGVCRNGPSHGPATNGQYCGSCVKKQVASNARRLLVLHGPKEPKPKRIPKPKPPPKPKRSRMVWEMEKLAQTALALRGHVPKSRIKVTETGYDGNPLAFSCMVDGVEMVFEMPQAIANMIYAVEGL
jgi:hypothetical protein